MSASLKQILANALNAQRSTGPKTEEGKKRSSLNALRHGLSARVVVLSTEDLAAYKKFSTELVDSFAPETPFEKQLAQAIADSQWRLNRARGIEDGLLALGHNEAPGNINATHPEIHNVLTAAGVFRQISQAFVNLSIYEQRLHRTIRETFKQLQAIQAERKAARAAALQQVRDLRNLDAMQGLPWDEAEAKTILQKATSAANGFVHSTAEIDAEIRRFRRFEEAKIARQTHYDHPAYREQVQKLAA